MGRLMSDAPLIDLAPDDSMRLLENLRDSPRGLDAALDRDEEESPEPTG